MPSGLRICQSDWPWPSVPWHVAQVAAKISCPVLGGGVGVGPSMLGGEEQATTKARETIRNAIARANRRIVIPKCITYSMVNGNRRWSKIGV